MSENPLCYQHSIPLLPFTTIAAIYSFPALHITFFRSVKKKTKKKLCTRRCIIMRRTEEGSYARLAPLSECSIKMFLPQSSPSLSECSQPPIWRCRNPGCALIRMLLSRPAAGMHRYLDLATYVGAHLHESTKSCITQLSRRLQEPCRNQTARNLHLLQHLDQIVTNYTVILARETIICPQVEECVAHAVSTLNRF